MSDDGLFTSSWMKCYWGVAHTLQFLEEMKTGLEKAQVDPPFTTRQEYHSEFHGFSIKIDSIRPVPARWGLLLGDIVNTFHSCLDNLAWALVCRGTRPPGTLTERERRSIYFPICSTNDIFNQNVNNYLPGVSRRDIAIIRKAQPYFHGKTRVGHHCLTTLQSLSNHDKHRTIQPVWLRQDNAWYEVADRRDCAVRRIRIMQPDTLEVDTEIARVYAKKTGPDPDIALRGNIATSIAIGNGSWLTVFLESIYQFVPSLLGNFSHPQEELKKLLFSADLSG